MGIIEIRRLILILSSVLLSDAIVKYLVMTSICFISGISTLVVGPFKSHYVNSVSVVCLISQGIVGMISANIRIGMTSKSSVLNILYIEYSFIIVVSFVLCSLCSIVFFISRKTVAENNNIV